MLPLHSREINALPQAVKAFFSWKSPWLILAVFIVTTLARIIIGDWGWMDLGICLGLALVYPFGEWAIHVYFLHLKPFQWRGRMVELPTARGHRQHHEHPNDLRGVLLAPIDVALLLMLAVPVVCSVILTFFAIITGDFPVAPLLTGVAVGSLLVMGYEWVHFLIHTSYRPRGRFFKRLHRNHRLHHFKNGHYWHGITSVVADRAFNTNPDHQTVEKSPTAKSLR